MSLKTFKYRLYPNKEQAEELDWTLDRCRELYNAALQERCDAWNVCKQHPNYYDSEWRKEHTPAYSINFYDQSLQLPELKEFREEYKDMYAQILQDVLKRVKKTFDAFFARMKNGEKAGYPRFQGKNRYDSFTYPQNGFSLTHDNRICLSKIGSVKIKLHRELQGKIKTCTIKREGTHWYVCFACEVEVRPKLPYTDEAVGIDLGLLHLATLSTGDTIENPRYYRKSEKKLKKAQEVLSRKKRGSNRRKKAVQRVAKCHRKVRNQRSDYLHKESRKLVETYETIVFEDLHAANMSKRPKPKQDETGKYLPNGAAAKGGLNKSIQDAGWAQLVQYTTYKAVNAGVSVLTVNPYKTSQVCSACKLEGPHKDLSERTHTCVHCGVVLDRDHNAALNILRLGLNQRGSNAA
jgi:putative transposase